MKIATTTRISLLCSLMIVLVTIKPLSDARGWGRHGHELSGRVRQRLYRYEDDHQ